MSLMDDLGNLARQFASGNASEADVHGAFDRTAPSVPQASLATALSHTFQSDQTPPFEQMVANLFRNSTPEQKAAVLNQLAAALGSGGLASSVRRAARPDSPPAATSARSRRSR